MTSKHDSTGVNPDPPESPDSGVTAQGSLSFLAEGLAHQLNNVFAPIITSLEVLQYKPHDEVTRELLTLMQRHARQGTHLAQQILSLANGIEHSYTSVQPHVILQSLKKYLVRNTPANIHVQFQSSDNLWDFLGNLHDLHQVLFDLAIHAVRQMPAGGTLAIKAENIVVDDDFADLESDTGNSRFVLFLVTHSGPGLSEGDLRRMFDPTPARHARGPATNQSLIAADRIVKAHGGQIKVDGESGSGVVFKVFFPAAPGSAPNVAGEKSVPRGRNECILVVDDDDTILSLTRRILEVSGYRVQTARNGADALMAYLQIHDQIALVLMDMQMPYLDGPLATHALRKVIPTPGLSPPVALILPPKQPKQPRPALPNSSPNPTMPATFCAQLTRSCVNRRSIDRPGKRGSPPNPGFLQNFPDASISAEAVFD